ncbi:MAG: HNH endonuclease, partial [Anaeromyxobacteraceae bacterium]|nr:HNH endonuclease [Anaeromyxobacteraceae bacterium]
ADLRRLHLTVSRGLLAKLEAARGVLSHVLPGATTEQVLEAALDLLLDRQARAAKQLGRARRGRRLARRAAASSIGAQVESAADSRAEAKADGRTAFVTASRGVSDGEDQASAAGLTHVAGRPHRRQDRDARAIPAAVEREVRARDGGRCQFPLDAGGICGSTTRIQLDHVVPVALGGQATVENLRLLCATHNRYAARLALGEGVMARARRRGAKRESGGAMRRDHTQTFD